MRPARLAQSRQAAGGKLKVQRRHQPEAFLTESSSAPRNTSPPATFFRWCCRSGSISSPGVAPFDIYRALRTVNPSPYMYFLRMGDMHVLGSSPEMLVRVTGRKLEYRPIAGTHPRGRDEAEDQRLERTMLRRRKRTRRARDAGRPGTQRPGPGQRVRLGESARPDVRGALLARHASGVGARRQAAQGTGCPRRVRRLLSRPAR